eukprot:5717185-Amphidinium_carterae.1
MVDWALNRLSLPPRKLAPLHVPSMWFGFAKPMLSSAIRKSPCAGRWANAVDVSKVAQKLTMREFASQPPEFWAPLLTLSSLRAVKGPWKLPR